VTLVDDMGTRDIDDEGDGQLHEPWVFLTMLDQMSTSEVNIGFVYSVIELLARRYQLTDAVVVLRDESLGTQAFRLGQKSLDGDSPASLATSPGVFCEPDIVPNVVRDVVRNVCQLALTLHLARHSADHDPLTNIANRRHFDAALRNASVQSARYGWAFTLVLIDLDGFKAVNDKLGHAVGDDMLRSFGWALRRSRARFRDRGCGWSAPPTPRRRRRGARSPRSPRRGANGARARSPLQWSNSPEHDPLLLVETCVGRAGSGPLIGGAEATLSALRDLGDVIPFYLMGVTKVDTVIGCSVIVALRSLAANDDRMGIALAGDDLLAASKATLDALNRYLSLDPERRQAAAAGEIESGGGEGRQYPE
jgi:GGDEF domain-containing protein